MKEALKLALEALESGVDTQIGRVAWTEYDSCLISDAITAIKEVLAQPEQEPVGFFDSKLNPIQRTWVGLTEDEAFACKGRDYFETYRAIEAKLRSKNTWAI
jgi:hypothetical protein